MSLFGAIAPAIKAADGLSWGDLNTLWSGLYGGYRARSGVAVSWQTSLRCTTFLACTRRLAEAVSTVPTKLYKQPRGSKRREEAFDHELYDLLNFQPNEFQDSLQFKETLAVHFAAAGNAYAFINRVNGKIAELIPIVPTHVQARQLADFSVEYTVTAPNGSQAVLTAREIFHLRGLSFDGFRGLDIVQMLQEPLGLALATEQTHAMLHANGMRPSGMLSAKSTLNETELVRLAAWVKKHYSGLDNVQRVMVLDKDITFTPFDMKGVDAQHLELRRHEIESICHGMGVLPIVIGYPAEMAARAAAETLVAMHLVHTIRPLHRRFEKAFDRQLLTPAERKEGYYTKFIDAEFLRATAKDRAAFYQTALGGGGSPGWASTNDVCDWEDMDSVEGGDMRYMPVNLAPIGPDGMPKLPPAPPAPAVPGPAGGATQGKAMAELLEAFFKVYNPNQQRDDHGRWGDGSGSGSITPAHAVRTKARIAATANWLRTTPAQEIIARVATSDTTKGALTLAIGGLIAHGMSIPGAGFWYQEPHLADDIAVTVHNFAAHAQVTSGEAKQTMRRALEGLLRLRSNASKTRVNALMAGKAAADQADLLPTADELQALIDALDAVSVKAATIFLTAFERDGKTYGGELVAADLADAERVAGERGRGERVIGELIAEGDG